jgi:hypothetical protein
MCSSICGRVSSSTRLDRLEIDPDSLQRIGQRDAILILQATCLVHIGEPERRMIQTGLPSALVRPVHQSHRHRRLTAILRAEPAQNFHAGQKIEAAIGQPPFGTESMWLPGRRAAIFLACGP